ncbi:MAG TPA: peptide chain release factor N(5)-glutamine methyltransferase [Terracidiphilus sp.]|nr:peptide chain release factor N(5)-glutamine methyltransferase [Terracidiphilus sp.]
MTLREWLKKGEADLGAGPHPERARQDAELLLLHFIGNNRARLLAHLDDDFGGCSAISFAAHLRRRAAGEPIQYIVGECEFYGLSFRVTPAVLIPRPETEHLVEQALVLAARFTQPRILDVGTGSGAIAIALAKHLIDARISASDISAPALACAQDNAKRNEVGLRFLLGDLLVPAAGEIFDLIVSNPPYVPEADRHTLSVEVRDHEPAQALFAGADGLGVYRRLIPASRAALVTGGFLVLEIGHGQAAVVAALLESAGFASIAFTPDLQGIPRVVTAQRL